MKRKLIEQKQEKPATVPKAVAKAVKSVQKPVAPLQDLVAQLKQLEVREDKTKLSKQVEQQPIKKKAVAKSGPAHQIQIPQTCAPIKSIKPEFQQLYDMSDKSFTDTLQTELTTKLIHSSSAKFVCGPNSALVGYHNNVMLATNCSVFKILELDSKVLRIRFSSQNIYILTKTELICLQNEKKIISLVQNGSDFFVLNDTIFFLTNSSKLIRFDQNLVKLGETEYKQCSFLQFMDIVYSVSESDVNNRDKDGEEEDGDDDDENDTGYNIIKLVIENNELVEKGSWCSEYSAPKQSSGIITWTGDKEVGWLDMISSEFQYYRGFRRNMPLPGENESLELCNVFTQMNTTYMSLYTAHCCYVSKFKVYLRPNIQTTLFNLTEISSEQIKSEALLTKLDCKQAKLILISDFLNTFSTVLLLKQLDSTEDDTVTQIDTIKVSSPLSVYEPLYSNTLYYLNGLGISKLINYGYNKEYVINDFKILFYNYELHRKMVYRYYQSVVLLVYHYMDKISKFELPGQKTPLTTIRNNNYNIVQHNFGLISVISPKCNGFIDMVQGKFFECTQNEVEDLKLPDLRKLVVQYLGQDFFQQRTIYEKQFHDTEDLKGFLKYVTDKAIREGNVDQIENQIRVRAGQNKAMRNKLKQICRITHKQSDLKSNNLKQNLEIKK